LRNVIHPDAPTWERFKQDRPHTLPDGDRRPQLREAFSQFGLKRYPQTLVRGQEGPTRV
jgi:hypothetical protein